MKKNSVNEDIIDQYLDGTMNAIDRERFEQKMRRDQSLRSSVSFQMDIRQGIILFEAQRLKDVLKESE